MCWRWEMANVRDRYDAYCEAVARETYHFRSGRKPTLDLDEVDDRFGDVTSGDFLDEVRQAVEGAFTDEERTGNERIRVALEAARVDRATRPLLTRLREREAAQKLVVDRTEQTVYGWQAGLGSVKDATRRRRVQEGLESAWAELNPMREELWASRTEHLSRHGPANALEWARARHPGVDYEAWASHADRLLEETEGIYRDGLSKGLAGIGVDPAEAHPGDTARLFRMEAFDSVFPAARLMAALDFTTEGMGIALGAVPGVHVDSEPRPGKHPRACVVAPRIPGEVYVLLHPDGGESDYETLFHEAGHAFHMAFTSASLPVERRRLDDPGLSETWAFLLHYRLADAEWIDESPAAKRAGILLPAIRFRKLFLLRRYAAKLRYELELSRQPAGDDPSPYAELYAEELGRATGLRYREAGYLVDTDPDLYCVDYLRAWSLEARLEEFLRERFGRRFWKERRAGDLLKELWNTGGTYTAEGLADELGIGPVEPTALIDTLRR
jgi:hypothetical protein